jgi:hypothetical protein
MVGPPPEADTGVTRQPRRAYLLRVGQPWTKVGQEPLREAALRPLRTLIALVLFVAASPARAQNDDEQLTLPSGRLLLNVFLELNLSTDVAGKPISIAPDLWYGVTDDFTLGLVHSGRGRNGLFGSVADALCLTGSDNGCPRLYDKVGLDARYQLLRAAGVSVAADGGLFASSLDPFTLSLKLGVDGRLRSGRLAIELSPSLFVGLTQRDSGNKEVLDLPANLLYTVCDRFALAAQLGLQLPFSSTGDLWALGASLGGQYQLSQTTALDLAFSLPILAGGSKRDTGFDARVLTLGVGHAF